VKVGKRLYVGNLSYNMDNEQLQSLFSEFGTVTDAHVVRDRETGRSRGFGFVTMEDDGDAQAAIEALNDKDQDGRPLRVNEARPREGQPQGGGRGPRSRY
jgi:RNA recognition motif-containing protein